MNMVLDGNVQNTVFSLPLFENEVESKVNLTEAALTAHLKGCEWAPVTSLITTESLKNMTVNCVVSLWCRVCDTGLVCVECR